MLGCEGYEVDQLAEGTGVVDRIREHPPDLVLLDVLLPDVSGFELCGDLRMKDETRQTPIILLTSAFQDEESVVRGLLAGADDYIVTPSRLDEVRARVRVQLRNRRDRELLQWARTQGATLRVAAMEDGLTGLANRRAADRALDAMLTRGDRVLAVAIDVDRFKAINDGYGHAVGDRVLAQVASALASCTRSGDLAARYGGEEFLVLVRGASLEVASRIGERYRAAVRRLCLGPGAPSDVSVSVGIAGAQGSGRDRSGRPARRGRRGTLRGEADGPRPRGRGSGPRLLRASRAGWGGAVMEAQVTRPSLHDALARALTRGTSDLPTRPRGAADALRLARSREIDFGEIEAVSGQFPPLAARLLSSGKLRALPPRGRPSDRLRPPRDHARLGTQRHARRALSGRLRHPLRRGPAVQRSHRGDLSRRR